MPILSAIRRGAAYLWDRSKRLFHAAADRKPVQPRTVRLALDDVLDAGAQRLRGLSKQCAAGKRSTAEWVAGVRSELTSLHLAARLAAIGGIAQWTPEHTQAAATTLAGQFGYLNRFADQVDAGDVDPDSSGFAERTASYADAARVLSYEDPRRQQEALGGSRWERRVLDPQADHCDGCRAAADDGWVPIGTSPAIGTLDCGQRCRCHVDYSSDETSPDDADFGAEFADEPLEGGKWLTINGAHVYIKEGKVAAGPEHLKGKPVEAIGKPEYEKNGSDLGSVFHGGKKKIDVVDPSKFQQRDAGFYGQGFYVTSHPHYAKSYGPKITEFAVHPEARVLKSGLTPQEAHPQLLSDVKQHYYETSLERARARGKEHYLKEATEAIGTNPLDWARAVDQFGTHHGYDIIAHSSGEIVVKNPAVLQAKVSRKGKPKSSFSNLSAMTATNDADFGVSRVVHTDAVRFEGADDSGPEPSASVVLTEAIEFAEESDGHWVTLGEGQHVFITSGGDVLATHDAINKHFKGKGTPEKAGKVIADKPGPGKKAPVKREAPKAAVPAGPAQPIGQRIRDDRAGDAIIDRLRSIEETTSAKTEAYESARSAYNKYVLDSSLKQLGSAEGQARRVELETAGLRAKAEYDQAQQSIRSKVGAALAVADPVSWSHEHPYAGTTMGLDQERRAALEEARSFVEPIVAAGRGDDTRHAIEWNQIPSHMAQRSHSSFVSNEISLGTDADAGTAVHEWGHVIEQQVPGARAAALEFLAHRVGNEPITSFASMEPGAGYRPDEGGRKDNFDRAFKTREAYYIGKSYGGRGTEVLSMGIEKLYRDPLTFARKDPEYAKFIIGVLHGRFR